MPLGLRGILNKPTVTVVMCQLPRVPGQPSHSQQGTALEKTVPYLPWGAQAKNKFLIYIHKGPLPVSSLFTAVSLQGGSELPSAKLSS